MDNLENNYEFKLCNLSAGSTAGVVSGLLPGAEKAGEDL
jgi:hypothetical protein